MILTTACGAPLRRALVGAGPRPRLASPAPRAFTPLFAPHRALSLWPLSTPPSPTPDEPPAPPGKPSLADLSTPASLPDPTFLEPLSAAFLSLPPSLSLSYAAFIPLFTLFYRSTTTLPIVLWQRRRTRRFADVVMPLLRREQGRLALETRDECRRAGKSYEEYQEVFKKKVWQLTPRVWPLMTLTLTWPLLPRPAQAKKAAYALARKYRCSPRLTLILPPVTHIPIFITATLVLRDACARATSALSITPSSLPSLLEGSHASALSSTALAHLHDLAATPFLWCPSLVLPDPTMALPLAVGLAALLNVEVTAKTRRAATAAAEVVDRPGDAVLPATGAGGPGSSASASAPAAPPVSASERRRRLAQRARAGASNARVRTLATASAPPPHPPPSPSAADLPRKPSNERRVTNILRGASIAFIPLAAMAPSVRFSLPSSCRNS